MPAHADLLTGDSDVLRAWRKANSGVKLDCSKVDFTNRPAFDHRDFSDVDFSGANFAGTRLHDVNFRDSNLSGANLKGANLTKANLTGANLTEADCSNASFNEANLTNTKLIGTKLHEANLTAVVLSEHVVLRNANLSNATLQQVSLKGVDLSDCDLTRTAFAYSDLSVANFSRAALYRSNFHSANLTGAIFNGARLDEANFQNAVLEKASLVDASLRGADLREANFRDARCSGADFFEARCDLVIFERTSGLNLAHNLPTVRITEPLRDVRYFDTAIVPFADKWLSWERIRVVGRLPLFGASYSVLIAIPFLYYLLDIFNRRVDEVRAWAENISGQDEAYKVVGRLILDHLHREPIPSYSRELLIFTFLLGCGATLFVFFCPARIKEFNREQWTDQLRHSLAHYLPLAWRKRWLRIPCVALYTVGGGGALLILLNKLWNVLLFIIRNS